jgi:glucan phosphoethanolaminetransferase (alkaline phosphatase superfamily)
MPLSATTWVLSRFALTTRVALSLYNLLRAQSVLVVGLVVLQRHSSRRVDVYNILWAVVFGFATLNILSLAARRFEPNRRGLTFGELMAVLVVLLSIFLLGWELLSLVHIFPIKLHR